MLAAAVMAAVLAVPAAGGTRRARPYDFNGDGYADLAIGVPLDTVERIDRAGAVNVLYGGSEGVTAAGDQLLTQNSPGLQDTVEWYDRFGSAVTSADFDRDGYADLAVGAPFEGVGGTRSAGAVHVLYGTAQGLSAARDQFWRQGSDGVPGSPGPRDRFGFALAAGDWDRDGFPDLAVGVPGEEVGDAVDAGEVQVLRGSGQGLTTVGVQTWNQDTPGVADEAEYRRSPSDDRRGYPERFGEAVVGGDIDADGIQDLIVGAPGETVPGSCDSGTPDLDDDGCDEEAYGAGAVHVLFGTASGLTSDGDEFWHQNRPKVAGAAWTEGAFHESGSLTGESFGTSLTVGDFNNDGRGDVAAGAPYDSPAGAPTNDGRRHEGSVTVLYGSATGLRGAGSDHWHLKAAGVDVRTWDPFFGAAVSAGDVDRDGDDDLAIGVPGLNVQGRALWTRYRLAGGVLLLRGRADGLTKRGRRLWTQDTPGVKGTAEGFDHFGGSVALLQLGRSRRPELIVGAPGEGHERTGDDSYQPSARDRGRVSLLYGGQTGPTAKGDQVWSRSSQGVRGKARKADYFGWALADSTWLASW